MKRNPAKKLFVLLMALWCARSLTLLAGELRAMSRELQILEEAIRETELQIGALEEMPEAREIQPGDLVFFDAGKRNCIVEARHGRGK